MPVGASEDAQKPVEKKRPSAQDANCFSRLFFLWVNPLVAKSLRTVIENEDTFEIPPSSEVALLTSKFDTLWQPQKVDAKVLEKGKYLLQVGKKLFWGRYCFAAALMWLQNIANMAVPFLLKAFVDWFTDQSRPSWHGWVFGGSLVGLQIFSNQICANHGILQLYIVGMDCRSLVNSLVYRKAMRLSQKSRSQTTVGQVVSLMSSDSERLPMAVLGLFSLATTPLTILYGLVSLLALIGWAGLVAVIVMLLTIPLPMKIGAYQGKTIMKQMVKCDTRVKTVNEGLQGIRVLKYYAWDSKYGERVRDHRIQEIRELRNLSWVGALSQTIMSVVPLVMSLAMIITYFSLDPDRFTPANVFTSLSLLNLIRMPLAMLPMGIKGWVDLKSTCARLQRYLLLDEQSIENPQGTSGKGENQAFIEIQNGSFKWETGKPIDLGAPGKGKGKGKGQGKGKEEQGKGAAKVVEEAKKDVDAKEPGSETEEPSFGMSDVSLIGKAGQLCAIVGKVGSGKSSLLNAMLSEMPKQSGEVNVQGSIAYCSQVPWIQNATLRDNILFGSQMDEKRYNEVVNMCALGPDCDALPGGDLTEIGEKGVTLSGGQKARVALARACYRQADMYILDDVLSAVDAETGAYLFERCIQTLLNRNCLVVLATNAMNFLDQAATIWVLKAGCIVEQGTFDELRGKEDGALNEIMSVVATQNGKSGNGSADADPASKTCDGSADKGLVPDKSKGNWSVSNSKKTDEEKGKLTAKELRAEGSVSWKVWYFYFVTCPGGFCFPCFVLLSAFLGQSMKNVFEWWLSYWSTQTAKGEDEDYHLPMYAGLGAAACVFQFCRALVLAELILRNGRRMHELLLANVMRAPMSFFETTSIGRILNRFSKDMNSMDTELQRTMPTALILMTDILGLSLTIGINMPFFFLPLVPLLVFYWDVSRRFRPINRDLQRLESTSRSPIFAQFSETLQGASTIRAYGDAQRFLDKSVSSINSSNSAFFTIHNANRWLQLRLEIVGSLLLTSVLALSIEGRSSGNLQAGVVALALFYASNCTQIMNFAIRMFTETEARMTSAERIYEYVTQIDSEALEVTKQRPSAGWPSNGQLELRGVSMRYRPKLPFVLNDVSLVIDGGSKVGVCGRTGSGKSTILNVLFRIVDIYSSGNDCKGTIHIDGLDVGEIGLSDLRRALAIIPQDAVMFAGTVRENLDLFGERGDEEIWDALRNASMEDHVRQMPDGIKSLVQEGGENFSCGERQLVCLARALLRQSRIICLDEATANIDVKTDATIQEVIKTKFVDRTVLTIAHRLNTIATHDKILVMDAGQVAEYGPPAELLALGKDGQFWRLVQELGESAAAQLETEVIAKSKLAEPRNENENLTFI